MPEGLVCTIRDYKELYVALHDGFSNAEDYYAQLSALRFVARIQLPTFVIYAQDDPLDECC